MKVAIVTTLGGGGPVEHALLLAEGLRDIGASVAAVCSDARIGERFSLVTGDVRYVDSRSFRDTAGALRLRKAVGRADVLHTHDRKAALWLLRVRPQVDIKVHTAHGIADPYLPEPIGTIPHRWRDRLAYELVEPWVVQGADAVVVPSHAVANDLIARLRWPAGKITVIANGVRIPSVQKEARRRVVGTVARLDPFKGLDVWIRAAALVGAQESDVRFVIYGSGDQQSELLGMRDRLGLQHRLSFAGHVPSSEALGGIGIFVSTSYWENAPLATLEAMAAGIPIVATEVAGVPEMLPRGTARLVPAGSPEATATAVLALLADPAAAQAQAAAAFRRAASAYSYDQNAANVAALYSDLLSNRRGRRRRIPSVL